MTLDPKLAADRAMSGIPDGALLQADMRRILNEKVAAAGSQAAWASARGVPVRAVGMTIARDRGFSEAVANGLGFQRIDVYVPIPRKRPSDG